MLGFRACRFSHCSMSPNPNTIWSCPQHRMEGEGPSEYHRRVALTPKSSQSQSWRFPTTRNRWFFACFGDHTQRRSGYFCLCSQKWIIPGRLQEPSGMPGTEAGSLTARQKTSYPLGYLLPWSLNPCTLWFCRSQCSLSSHISLNLIYFAK